MQAARHALVHDADAQPTPKIKAGALGEGMTQEGNHEEGKQSVAFSQRELV